MTALDTILGTLFDGIHASATWTVVNNLATEGATVLTWQERFFVKHATPSCAVITKDFEECGNARQD